MSDFAHLHTHTTFSPLDGVATPEEYFKICADRKYPAIAITEHGNMASIPSAYLSSKKYGVKYIPGCEIYFNEGEKRRKEIVKTLNEQNCKIKDMSIEDKMRYNRHRHLTVLCKDMTGYQNLLLVRAQAYKEAFYNKPRASLEMFKDKHEGLCILSGCFNGPMSFEINMAIKYLNEENKEQAKICLVNCKKIMKQFKEVFQDDFYVELQMPGIEGDKSLMKYLNIFAKDLGIKTAITNDSHYIKESDAKVQRLMMAIDQNTTWDSPELFISKSNSGYFKTRTELRNTFLNDGYDKVMSIDDFETACDNTLEIAEKCNEFKPDLSSKLPNIEDANTKLKKLVAIGLKKRGLESNRVYIDRAKIELQRIIEKDFSSYFLICRELTNKSLSIGAPVGPRGSAGGSLVCYLIDIHELDPIKFDLSFDRFLSPSRGGLLLHVTMENDEMILENKDGN